MHKKLQQPVLNGLSGSSCKQIDLNIPFIAIPYPAAGIVV